MTGLALGEKRNPEHRRGCRCHGEGRHIILPLFTGHPARIAMSIDRSLKTASNLTGKRSVMTRAELAADLHVSEKTLSRAMLRHGIRPARPARDDD